MQNLYMLSNRSSVQRVRDVPELSGIRESCMGNIGWMETDRFKLRYFLYPPLKYMEWAERWVEGFIKGTFFGGFDFKEFRKEKLHSMEYDLYDTVKTIDVRLEEMERIISTMKNNGK